MSTQISNHADLAVAQLIEQFKKKPRIDAFIRVLGKYVQQLEDTFWDIYWTRFLETTYGPHLDVLGRIVGEERNAITTEDDDFRIIIKAKIRVLLSRGTGDDLIRISLLMLGVTPFEYSEHYPGQVQIDILDAPSRPSLPSLLLTMLRRAKAAGVRIDVSAADPDAFRYDSVLNGAPDVDHGFGSSAFLPDLSGALYAGLVH